MSAAVRTVGVVSDTHGLVRPQTERALEGVELIVHAGDIGRPEVIERLKRIAPVVAVRGNVDDGAWAGAWPETATAEAGDRRLFVLHRLVDLAIDPGTSGLHAVIAGHTHRPRIDWKDGVLYFNPGSAGPRRFSLPVSLGRIAIRDGRLVPELVTLI